MTEHAVLGVADQELARRDEPLGDYDQFVDSIGVNSAQRELAARRLLQRHPCAGRATAASTNTQGLRHP